MTGPCPRPNLDAGAADPAVGLTASAGDIERRGRSADQRRPAGAWDAYASRVLRLADDISRARFATREAQGAGVTAPQVFDRIGVIAQNRLAAVEDIVEAGRALYERLSPEQQRLADRKLALVALTLASGVAPAAGGKP
jgi:hypothetical protein